jgi:small subunit ribosomal protein S1
MQMLQMVKPLIAMHPMNNFVRISDSDERIGHYMTAEAKPTLTLEALSPATPVAGKVTYISLYGAMVDIGLDKEALLHISQLGDTEARNLEDVLSSGQEVEAYVLKVNQDNGQVALTMVKPPALPWEQIGVGNNYTGTVVRLEKFGAFVDIGAERPGMVHVSELTDGYVESPEDVVSVGQEVQARVIKVNRKKRQIDLSMRTPEEDIQTVMEPEEELPTAMAIALRRAMDGDDEGTSAERADGKKKRDSGEQDDIIARTLRSKHNR